MFLKVMLTWVVGITPLASLAVDGADATARGAPIVLYLSRSDCPFCRHFEHDVLGPLIKSGRFESQVIYRQLVMDDSKGVANFRGQTLTPAQLATELGNVMSPTVLLLDGLGRMLVPPRVGYNGNPYATFLLERAIAKSIAQMQTRKPAATNAH